MTPIAFLLLGLSWLQPDHFLPWMSWHSEILAFLAALTLLLQSALRSKQFAAGTGLSIPVSVAPFACLLLVVWVQWVSGLLDFFGDALVLSAYLVLCMASLSAGFDRGRSQQEKAYLLAVTLTIGALLSAVIAFVQVAEVWMNCTWINRMQYLGRPGANLGQPNQLGTLLLMGLVSLLYLYETNRLGRLVSVLMACVLVIALAATESRTAVLGFSVAFLWWLVRRNEIRSRLRLGIAGFMWVAFLANYWVWPQVIDLYFLTTATGNAVNTVAYNRWIIWPQLIDAIFLQPWWGWGLGQVSTAHNAVLDAYRVSEPYTYAHNIILDLALGAGVPFALLLIGLVSLWLWRRVRGAITQESWYCVAVIVPVAVHSMLEFPFAYAYFLVPAMFAIGVLEHHSCVQPLFQIHSRPLLAGVTVMAALLIGSVIEYVAVEEDFRVVRFEGLRIGETPHDYTRPDVLLLTQLKALLSAGRIKPRPGMPQDEIELARKVALHYPWLATQNRYALSLALNGHSKEAIRQLQVIHSQRGDKAYRKIKDAWTEMAAEKYPQLKNLVLP